MLVSVAEFSRRRRRWLSAAAVVLLVIGAELLAPGLVMAAGGEVAPQDQDLSAGAIVGIVASFLLAGLLLLIALPFILPKPPGK